MTQEKFHQFQMFKDAILTVDFLSDGFNIERFFNFAISKGGRRIVVVWAFWFRGFVDYNNLKSLMKCQRIRMKIKSRDV